MLNLATFLLSVFFLLWGWPAVSAAEPVLEVDQLVEEALAANPELKVARQRAEAFRQRVPQAGALDDPMVGFGLVNVPDDFDLGAEDMTMKEFMVSQKFPFFGKRSLMREAAQKEAEAVTSQIDETTNQIVKNVKAAFYDLSHVHRATEITRRNKAILEDFSRLAHTRYSVGEGIQEDTIRVQVEISRMVDDLLMLEQRRKAIEARVNFLLSRPSATPLGVPEEVVFKPYPVVVEELQQSALENNPVLKAMQQNIEMREKNLSLAKKDIYPDFNFKVAYGQREDRLDMYTAAIEMNIPVFARSKQNRKVDESLAELRSERASFEAMKNEIFFMIADMGAMAQRLEKQVELYTTGILPQTSLQIQSALSAYTVNKADFMTLLDSRMKLYRFELDYHQALTDYEKNLAALEAAVGTRFADRKEEK